MKIDLNDPQLTAYAIGELQGQEAEEMRNRIEQDPAAQKYVEDIQQTSRLLTEEFSQEDAPRLSVEQRNKIYEATEKSSLKKSLTQKSWFRWTSGLAVAGLVGLMLNLNHRFITPPPAEDQVVTLPAEEEYDGYVYQEPVHEVPAEEVYDDSAMAGDSPPAEEITAEAEIQADESAPAPMPKAEVKMMAKKYVAESYGRAQMLGLHKGHGLDVGMNRDKYAQFTENEIYLARENPLSTFSADVDTASYAMVRKSLIDSMLPNKDAVRTEEMINYFPYAYAPPTDGKPFATHIEVAKNPWNKSSQLVKIGIKGMEIPETERPASNLVFLIDVSGSMEDANKLPLVKKSLELLVDKMTSKDRIALVVYAGSSGLVLDSTSGESKNKIKSAINNLSAGGSTNGGEGIDLAYKVAVKNMIKKGNNRVILATDGDFNVGTTSEGDLIRLIEEKRKAGVFLSTLGFGSGNFQDSTMQKLANKGNGNNSYIDNLREAKKVLLAQAGGTLHTIAKDVKLQVEFNPQLVSKYRLIGYEKRKLDNQDFNDDTKDAGEIGSGHTVTAFYEVFPANGKTDPKTDSLKYQATPEMKKSDELLTVKIRYKEPTGTESKLLEFPVANQVQDFDQTSSDFKFAASVVQFSEIMKETKHKGTGSLTDVLKMAEENKQVNGKDDNYRKEFVELVKKARSLKNDVKK